MTEAKRAAPNGLSLPLSLLVVLLASLTVACSSRKPPLWVPAETMPARAAIDAHWDIADKYLGQAVRDRKIVGAEVLVVTPDGWSSRGFGWATASALPTERTIYELGSISKVFTGTLLAEMSLRREVSLNEPAQNLIPGRGRMPPSGRPITLLDLATHMSGMPRLPPGMKAKNKLDPYADFTVDDLWASLEKTRLDREPGLKKEYSNFGVGLLGQLLVERADADSYEELLRERVLAPLGMSDTSIELRSDQEKRFAWGHDKDNRRTPPWNIVSLAGAGGLRSTARDMSRFMQAHLRNDSPIAAAATEALAPRGIPGEGKWDQGLGWVVRRDRRMAWHNGGTGGFHTWMGLDLAHGLGVLVLCNTSTGEVDTWGTKILVEMRGKMRGGAADDAQLDTDDAAALAAVVLLEDEEEVASR
jgi:D-alanyl-D-alanine-carboxypeptidase/D-alanyl-D-alanine-endopeptidase